MRFEVTKGSIQMKNTYDTVVAPPLAKGMVLLIGEEVFELFSDPVFQAGWNDLYSACSWSTAFQSWAFVSAWYQTYKEEYLPIVVKSESKGQVDGILTMALQITNAKSYDPKKLRGRIVGAGQYEAEYQTWLAKENKSEYFIKAALNLIRGSFPKCDIHFRFLPPSTPLAWVEADKQWKRYTVLQSCSRPLMDMNAPDISKLFRKPEFRNKLNRLKKLGDLKFERITDKDSFTSVLPELTVHYDFRQGAMFNKNQFRDSPSKARFLLAMFEQNLLHVTVLKVNEDILASIVAVEGKGWVHLGGINIHTPFYASYYSPGFVHFLMLGQLLLQEGVSMFDLTPGGDSYKERMATSHDQVYELYVASSLSVKLKKELRKRLHSQLIKGGIRPMSMELALRKKKYLLKSKVNTVKKNPKLLLSLLTSFKGQSKNQQDKIYLIERGASGAVASVFINENSLRDLLDFDGSGSLQTRWEFLEEAMRGLEQGDCCYTWGEGGRLLACVWQERPRQPEAAGTAVLRGLYCHPAGRSRLRDFLGAVAGKVAGEKEEARVCLAVRASDKEVHACLKGSNYTLQYDSLKAHNTRID